MASKEPPLDVQPTELAFKGAWPELRATPPPQNPANLPQARALLAPWRFPLLDLARMFLERRSSVGYRGSAPARETLEVVLMLKCAKFGP